MLEMYNCLSEWVMRRRSMQCGVTVEQNAMKRVIQTWLDRRACDARFRGARCRAMALLSMVYGKDRRQRELMIQKK